MRRSGLIGQAAEIPKDGTKIQRLRRPRYRRILAAVQAKASPAGYMDTAMSPVEQGEEENMQLFTATVSAQEFVKKRRALAEKRRKVSNA